MDLIMNKNEYLKTNNNIKLIKNVSRGFKSFKSSNLITARLCGDKYTLATSYIKHSRIFFKPSLNEVVTTKQLNERLAADQAKASLQRNTKIATNVVQEFSMQLPTVLYKYAKKNKNLAAPQLQAKILNILWNLKFAFRHNPAERKSKRIKQELGANIALQSRDHSEKLEHLRQTFQDIQHAKPEKERRLRNNWLRRFFPYMYRKFYSINPNKYDYYAVSRHQIIRFHPSSTHYKKQIATAFDTSMLSSTDEEEEEDEFNWDEKSYHWAPVLKNTQFKEAKIAKLQPSPQPKSINKNFFKMYHTTKVTVDAPYAWRPLLYYYNKQVNTFNKEDNNGINKFAFLQTDAAYVTTNLFNFHTSKFHSWLTTKRSLLQIRQKSLRNMHFLNRVAPTQANQYKINIVTRPGYNLLALFNPLNRISELKVFFNRPKQVNNYQLENYLQTYKSQPVNSTALKLIFEINTTKLTNAKKVNQQLLFMLFFTRMQQTIKNSISNKLKKIVYNYQKKLIQVKTSKMILCTLTKTYLETLKKHKFNAYYQETLQKVLIALQQSKANFTLFTLKTNHKDLFKTLYNLVLKMLASRYVTVNQYQALSQHLDTALHSSATPQLFPVVIKTLHYWFLKKVWHSAKKTLTTTAKSMMLPTIPDSTLTKFLKKTATYNFFFNSHILNNTTQRKATDNLNALNQNFYEQHRMAKMNLFTGYENRKKQILANWIKVQKYYLVKRKKWLYINHNEYKKLRNRLRLIEWEEDEGENSTEEQDLAFDDNLIWHANWFEQLVITRQLFYRWYRKYQRAKAPQARNRVQWLESYRRQLLYFQKPVYYDGLRRHRLKLYSHRFFRYALDIKNRREAQKHFIKKQRRSTRVGFGRFSSNLLNRLDITLLMLRVIPTKFWADKLIALGLVRINGQIITKTNYYLKAGDVIQWNFSPLKWLRSFFRQYFELSNQNTPWTPGMMPKHIMYFPTMYTAVYLRLPLIEDVPSNSYTNSIFFLWFGLESSAGH